MKCIVCKINDQSPGADSMCGTCWAKNSFENTNFDWPGYDQVSVMALVTGNYCGVCKRKLYAMPGDDKQAVVCVDCYPLTR